MKISEQTKKDIGLLSVQGNQAFAPTTPISNWAAVKKVFQSPTLGCKWHGRGKNYFEYSGEGDLSEKLTTLLGSGDTNSGHFFPTPESISLQIARRIVPYIESLALDILKDLADDSKITVLEPSFGSGALIGALFQVLDVKYHHLIEVTAVELNEDIYNLYKGNKVDFKYIEDFLESDKGAPFNWHHRNGKQYDIILMNPPFQRNQWIKHALKAYELLKPNGKMALICPNWEQTIVRASPNKAKEELRLIVDSNSSMVEDNEPEAFKEAGTKIDTSIVYLSRS